MGDRMSVSEGGSVNGGRHGAGADAARWGSSEQWNDASRWDSADRWESADRRESTDRWESADRRDARPPQDERLRDEGDDVRAGVLRRLQGRLDRHQWMLGRMQTGPADPSALGELLDTARRMRRDTESLLLLCGADPGARGIEPRSLVDVLHDAVAASEEPRRVGVRTPPVVIVTATTATELVFLLAELLDHAAGVGPGWRAELASRVELDGSVSVEVLTDPAAHHNLEAAGRPMAAAERMAQRSRSGLRVVPHGTGGLGIGGLGIGGLGVDGLVAVASVHCPASVVTLPEPAPARSNTDWFDSSFPGGDLRGSDLGGSDLRGSDLGGSDLRAHDLGGSDLGAYDLSAYDVSAPDVRGHDFTSNGANGHGANGGYLPPGPPPIGPSAPIYAPSRPSGVDELFGPLLDLPHEPRDAPVSTPIFEAIASAWFRDGGAADQNGGLVSGGTGAGPLDWETPADLEWRAAAARTTRPDPELLTSTGLPRRRPGDQLMAPPAPVLDPGERVPDRVRDRLSTYQRGLTRGRHRAADADQEAPDAW